MTRYDDAEDRDDPQPEDLEDLNREDDDEPETVRCPACGSFIYAGAPKCPRCGDWLDDDTPARRRSLGWIWPVLIALLIIAFLMMGL